jgi:hypothetical protein
VTLQKVNRRARRKRKLTVLTLTKEQVLALLRLRREMNVIRPR